MKIVDDVSTPNTVETQLKHPFVFKIIGAVAIAHLLNDLVQAALPAIYPMLKESYGLSFSQIGLITLTYQLTASILQPAIGIYTDKYPQPYLLPVGMLCALVGVFFFSTSTSFPGLVISSALIGVASSTFHPEASRVARMASGGRFGFAQSTFQVGGNFGTAIGPLIAAAIILPYGQQNFAWLMLFTLIGIYILSRVSVWYKDNLSILKIKTKRHNHVELSRSKIQLAFAVLGILIFSKYFYMASITSYYTFYIIEKFHLTIPQSQMYLFIFLGSVALGTFLGGPIGDKIGRKTVIWVSVLGAAPFTLLLPYADLTWTAVLSVLIGFVMSSAFPAIVVYAQELVPTKVGLVAGIFFGLMFGISGIAAAFLGYLADSNGVEYVYQICSYLPLIGILTVFLPKIEVNE